jgi:hypothetical protein
MFLLVSNELCNSLRALALFRSCFVRLYTYVYVHFFYVN